MDSVRSATCSGLSRNRFCLTARGVEEEEEGWRRRVNVNRYHNDNEIRIENKNGRVYVRLGYVRLNGELPATFSFADIGLYFFYMYMYIELAEHARSTIFARAGGLNDD